MNNQSIYIPVAGEFPQLPIIRIRPTGIRTSPTANVGWRYRRRYRLTHTGSETANQYGFAFDLLLTDALVSGGKALANGNDLRVWHNGSELSRILIDWNHATRTTLVWIPLPQVKALTSMDFQIVYGNPNAGAPPLPSAEEQMIFDTITASAARSTNAKWVYFVEEDSLNAGKGLWRLSSSTVQPISTFSNPGSWIPATTNPATDDYSQATYQTFVDSGTYNIAKLDAKRARSGSTAIQDNYGPDGVTLHVPTKITSLRCDLLWTNMAINQYDTSPIGKLVILSRQVLGEPWVIVYENATLQPTEILIPTATYTMPAGTKDIAIAVWPIANSGVSRTASEDRYARVRMNLVCEVNIDSTMIIQSIVQGETQIFELANEFRYGGGSYDEGPYGEYQKTIIGNAAGASGAGTPRFAVEIDQQVEIDNVNRITRVYNTALTTLIEEVPNPAVDHKEAVYAGTRTAIAQTDFSEIFDGDWITIQPYVNPLSNPSALVDASGWTISGATAGITVAAQIRDTVVFDSTPASFKSVVSANSAGVNGKFNASPDTTLFIPVGERTSIWWSAAVRTSNTNFVPRLEILWYDINQNLLSTSTQLDPTTMTINTWYRKVFAALKPDNAVFWQPRLRWEDNVGGTVADVWWDTVALLEADIAVYNATPGPLTVTFALQDRYAYA